MSAVHTNLAAVTLRGARALLIPMEKEHGPDLLKAGADDRIWSYMPMAVQNEDAMERFMAEALKARDDGWQLPFTIIDQETGDIVGSSRLFALNPFIGLEIGWTWLSPAVWRTRINSECKYLLMRHAFDDLGALRVQLKTDSRNERSQAAIERLGAKREGVLRKHMVYENGHIRDSVYFSVTDEEWPSVKSRLEGFLEVTAR